ncbi:hypothetical protein SAMN05216428_11261 [Nitrosospira sp. Nsp11]|nr:hypothetical protein SAMN05216428_11261 [Nitrosospira sp. Nsp11]
MLALRLRVLYLNRKIRALRNSGDLFECPGGRHPHLFCEVSDDGLNSLRFKGFNLVELH